VADLGDSPETQVESGFEPRPSRRFARLVGSPAVRKLSPRRLAWALLGSLGLLALVVVGGIRGVRGLTHWVAEQPENWIDFADIELQPGAPAFILSKSAGFLEKVKGEARLPDRLPILEIDPKELHTALRRNPWVEHVVKVEVMRHRLIASLIYRKPVAVVSVAKHPLVLIDKDGVILPGDDIDWIEKRPRPRIRGIPDPLPVILDVAAPISREPGIPYKSSDSRGIAGGVAPEVLKAARLAEYLQNRPKMTPAGHPCPDFEAIYPSHVEDGLLLLDTRKNWVFWGTAPGAELPQNARADEKWRMLTDWIDRESQLRLSEDEFLRFDPTGPELRKFLPDKPGPGSSPGSRSR